MTAKTKCDMDCFNCKFDDCINDKLEIEDYLASEKTDRDIIRERRQKRNRKLSSFAIARKKERKELLRDDAKAYAKAYYDLNRERYAKYRIENKEKKSAYDRSYLERNKERISKRKKVYGEKNREHLRERQKEWREKNREKIKEYQRQYYLRKKQEQK